MKSKPETWKQRYIRLLSEIADSEVPVDYDSDTPIADRKALWELEDSDYISGYGDENEKRQLRGLYIARISVKGRRLLEEFEKEEELKTSIGFLKEHRFGIYKWVFGIAASLIVAYTLGVITGKL